jgi:hypothetical protein
MGRKEEKRRGRESERERRREIRDIIIAGV